MFDERRNTWDNLTELSNLLRKANQNLEKEQLEKASGIFSNIFNRYKNQMNSKSLRQYVRILLRLGEVERSLEVISFGLEKYPSSNELNKLSKQALSLKNMEFQILASEQGDYRIIHYKQKIATNSIFITFGGIKSTFSSGELFGLPFLVEEGHDYVYISQSKNTQYQHLDFESFKEIFTPICEGKKVYTYGSSLGGYAAIYYAGAINAEAIAAGPMLPASPRVKGYQNDKIPILYHSIGDLESSTYPPIIIYDNYYEDDSLIVEEYILPYYPNAKLHKLPHAGHEALELLLEARLLKTTIQSVVNGETLSFSEKQEVFQETSRYLEEKSKYLFKKKQYEAAIIAAKEKVKKAPSIRTYNRIIQAYIQLCLPERAREVYEEAKENFATDLLVNPPQAKSHINSKYGIIAFSLENEEVLTNAGDMDIKINQGLGNVVLLSLILEALSSGRVSLLDTVTVSAWVERSSKARGSIDLREGEKISVQRLIDAMISNNAPDAMLAMSEKLYGTTGKAVLKMKVIKNQLNLSSQSVENVTGRELSSKVQRYTLSDLTKIAKTIFSHLPNQLVLLNTTRIFYKGRLFQSPSMLIAKGKIQAGYFFGENDGEGIALTYINGKKVAICITGAQDAFHRDYLITQLIEKLTLTTPITYSKENIYLMNPKIAKINILGDTYFGEAYTKLRQQRGIDDALTRYGYDYSFERLLPILTEADYNIANFEAVLTDLNQSPLQGKKGFILGGNIENSIAALKRQNIHAVTLGNNHTMDYGERGLYTTIESLSKAGIPFVGAGRDAKEANEPLKMTVKGQKLIIFSSYWYRNSAYQQFDFYAIGNAPGVACLSGEIFERIQKEKEANPDAFIITIMHWGVDWKKTHSLQKKYAQQLVENGADLIIGHGAHMMQDIQKIDGKWVLYGIGNGVFNSNGEYDKWGVPPYSLFLQLQINDNGEMSLRVYPLYTNNLNTFWQPYLVGNQEFEKVVDLQQNLGSDLSTAIFDKDQFGSFISLDLKGANHI